MGILYFFLCNIKTLIFLRTCIIHMWCHRTCSGILRLRLVQRCPVSCVNFDFFCWTILKLTFSWLFLIILAVSEIETKNRKTNEGKVCLLLQKAKALSRFWWKYWKRILKQVQSEGRLVMLKPLKSVSMRKPRGTRQGVIMLKSQISLKLGTNVRYEELTYMTECQVKILNFLGDPPPLVENRHFACFMHN